VVGPASYAAVREVGVAVDTYSLQKKMEAEYACIAGGDVFAGVAGAQQEHMAGGCIWQIWLARGRMA
jgi:hypothetical protein